MSELNENDLIEQFFRLENQLRKYLIIKSRESGVLRNKLLGQGRILSLLKLKPKTTQKELSYLLDMRPQSLGELLGKLEKKGYLTREPLENDRRILSIQLTEAGLEAANENEKQQDKLHVFDILSDEEKFSFSEITLKLLDALEQELSQNDGEYRRVRSHDESELVQRLRGSRDEHPLRRFKREHSLRSARHEHESREFESGQDQRGFEQEHDQRGVGPRHGRDGFRTGRDPRGFGPGESPRGYGPGLDPREFRPHEDSRGYGREQAQRVLRPKHDPHNYEFNQSSMEKNSLDHDDENS
ncbi:hypothetical protein CN692_11750 [Bacillus sp. AFS002410]|uniref:MarR family winged helix-turn-helix transcriptional regulator n=1 Tax=Bacillus sp. AFS002410 TaxID=2033481 RepID=UPI000BF07C9C|nr:MarR family transcriptional regulator [Bacillus sp. AFS002410]PEJ57755.1 hypothetical protein CN692_11750 [Bacillus sp. AFS002410]